MRPPLRVRLSPGQVAALERHYRRTPKPAERTRVHIILLSHQGYIPPAIATIVRVDPATVRRAIHRFERHGLRGLLNAPRPGRPRKVTPAWEGLLVRTVEQDPRRVGVLRAAWTAPALANYLAEKTGIRVSAERIRQNRRAKAAWGRHIWQESRPHSGGVVSGGMVTRTRCATGETLPAPVRNHR